MAELNGAELNTAELDWQQLSAVAWLRWRIFANAFRARAKKRSTTGMVVMILLRIVGYAFISCFMVGPVLTSGYITYARPWGLGSLVWIISTTLLMVSLNTTTTAMVFDLGTLLRFPVALRSYVVMRVMFGLLAIPTVVASLALLAAAVGFGLARHGSLLWALLTLGALAVANMLFIRMTLAWLDRWMSTKRARGVMGFVFLLFSLSVQFLLVGGNGKQRIAAIEALLAPLHPYTRMLPPSLAASSVLAFAHGQSSQAAMSFFGVVAWAGVFLGLFTVRLRREFRGENLSEAGGRSVRAVRRSAAQPVVAMAVRPAVAETATARAGMLRLPETLAACMEKEWIYLKRSGPQLYGLIMPLFVVFLLTRRNAALGQTGMLLPTAVGYAMMGLLASMYNVLGGDAAGYNLYRMAPVRLRDVMLAKNIVTVGVVVAEIALVCVAVPLISGQATNPAMLSATLTWACFTVLANLAVGNIRSLRSPTRFEAGKLRRAPASRGSAFLSLGVMLGTGVLGAVTIGLCHWWLKNVWLATPVFLVLDAAALAGYGMVLGRIDGMAERRNEDLIEVLTKAA